MALNKLKDYLNKIERSRRQDIMRLRLLIRRTIPKVKESFENNMPTYKYKDKVICALSTKKHYSNLYISNTKLLKDHREAFQHQSVGRTFIRFKSATELPTDVIKQILFKSTQEEDRED